MAPRAIDGKCRNNHKVAASSFRRLHQTTDHQHEDVRGSRARRAALVLVLVLVQVGSAQGQFRFRFSLVLLVVLALPVRP